MDASPSGSILIHLVDGTRQPLPSSAKWSATIFDGRSPSERHTFDISGKGSAELVKGLPYFDNFFDGYSVIVNAEGYLGAAWRPVNIFPAKPVTASLMLIPRGGRVNFRGATWQALSALRPRFAEILSGGRSDAQSRYAELMEKSGGLPLACLLNLLTAMSQITLPSGKAPTDYTWQPIWDDPRFPMKQDRFYAYVDRALIADVRESARLGAFSEEKDPAVFHAGATVSFKQTQFDVTNVQLTFHEGNSRTIPVPGGPPVDCVMIEPDIDYYKDPLAHFFMDVLPNELTEGKSDPRTVCVLRWIAGSQVAAEFNPLYTITT
ncbi:MAG: hypothetical protein P8Z30_16140 [Acidobacteriota bacterium]